MRSFMSAFSAFVIGLSGYKKKVADPQRRDKYIEKIRVKSSKPYKAPLYLYKAKPQKKIVDDVEVFVFNENKDKRIIYLHGGAFCEQPLLPHFAFCDKLASKTEYGVDMPVYKKAPDHKYDETFAFLENYYRSLLESKSSQDVVFMGDSSGGGLALSFCEYLKEIGLPQPKKMILLSPWIDVSMDTPFRPEFEKCDPSLQRDFLRVAGLNWAGGLDTHDYKVSPVYGDLKDLAPITVYYGTYEAIVDDARILKDKCEKAGVNLDYHEYEKMNHCFPIYPIPEAKKAQREIFDLLK